MQAAEDFESKSHTRLACIQATLQRVFKPQFLKVEDDSARHAGHAGAGPTGETHFNVTVVSADFAGRSRVDRSRLVHDALRHELASGLHALSLILRAPDEPSS